MNKIKVAILGATGAVGQRFIQLLADHPWFEIAVLMSSERSAGKKFSQACRWVLDGDPPAPIGEMIVTPLEPIDEARIAFSALPSGVAREIEPLFAKSGYAVCSNAKAFRMELDVPMIIPEVNADHLALIERQREGRQWQGFIITSPNCTTTGVAMPLKPLDQAFGVQQVFATSMQAASGAGYPGVPSLDMMDNVIPYIKGEEEKVEMETRMLLGEVRDGHRFAASQIISAHCNRVPVIDGHTVCLSLKLSHSPSVEEAIRALNEFRGPEVMRQLPSAPGQPIIVRSEPDRPQTRRDRGADAGMAVTVGRVRPCPIFTLRLVSLVHNTLRGAASGSILNAELLVAKGYIQ